MKLRDILWSLDIGAAFAVALAFGYFLPSNVSNAFVKDVYGVGISVLSIIFSVFFAALAIIISSGDNDFVAFLQSRGYFTQLLNFFRFTLVLLFISLLLSVGLYTLTSKWLDAGIKEQSEYLFEIFFFLFSYSLFASIGSAIDAMRYAERRIEYIQRTTNPPSSGTP